MENKFGVNVAREKNGKKTVEEATGRGTKSIFMPCDVTDLKQIKDYVDQTPKGHPKYG
jgi:hypothetical protein